MADNAMHDPLTMNVGRQVEKLISTYSVAVKYAPTLQNATSYVERANALAGLLLVPALCTTVASLFRPILVDLCARLLHVEELLEEKFVALATLLQPHVELFPVILALLQQPSFSRGPLALVNTENTPSLDPHRLQKLLVAYYRVLIANRDLPGQLSWPTTALETLFRAPHPDPGVIFLAIRCYGLQTGMLEADRNRLETELVGDVADMKIPIIFSEHPTESSTFVEACLFAFTERERINEARELLLQGMNDYYTYEDGVATDNISEVDLSPYISNVHGVFLLKSSTDGPASSKIIATPTAIRTLQNIAIHLSLRLPLLLSSPPSSGKSTFIQHLTGLLHPGLHVQILTLQLSDTSLDPRSLLGSYISSPSSPGNFEWREGALVRAMKEGKWVVLADIDRATTEVLGVLGPLVGSLQSGGWIGKRAQLEVPGREVVQAHPAFALFGTRSLRTGIRMETEVPKPTFLGAHRWAEIVIDSPTPEELRAILDARVPRLAGRAVRAIANLWTAIRAVGNLASVREIGLRQLEQFCTRIDAVLPSSYRPMEMDVDSDINEHLILADVFSNPNVCENILLEARDVFFGAGAANSAAKSHLDAIAAVIGDHLRLQPDRREAVLNQRMAEVRVEKDGKGKTRMVHAGRVTLTAKPTHGLAAPSTRPYAMHRPMANLIARIASAVSLSEPVLLAGETGTGKTSAISHLASMLNRPLISLNLSHQTEASDLVGGFRPMDARVPAAVIQERFLDLFGKTFPRKGNTNYQEEARKTVTTANWERAGRLWKEAARQAKVQREKTRAKATKRLEETLDADGPRKRRKTEEELKASQADWDSFERDVDDFCIQHVQNANKFAFAFLEGPLVKALRTGGWVLLDEINLASSETLECIVSILRGPTASITLTELGSLEPVPRHPDFRLFACMNPATDVGKKDLPPHIRARFTEIDVPPPDADRDTLLAIVSQYIGHVAIADKAAIMDVAEFYAGMKKLSEDRKLADGSNRRPHFSMRTLARALTFASDTSAVFGLRRALWEGVSMAFMMGLDEPSTESASGLAQRCLFSGKNIRAMLSRDPSPPAGRSLEDFVRLGPFFIERGPLPVETIEDYVLTPSVERKLIDLARIVLTRRFPVLIEGPTSAGKTSAVEYLARRTGHRFVRINNHEHTDIQEYIGTYVSDPETGKLTYTDGLLVRALRNGDWIVLDELNLAPTDVLEALNRLLDDNRELVIPETGEVVTPHPHFMLFATQNPPGLYAGRKVLSRAFRNRFLEVHFSDVPQAELETILCQRARIAPSYATKIVAVFAELQKRRQSARVFDSKQSFATLRDLFRWAGRAAIGYQQLAEDGYMLLAERARRDDDKAVVKEVIESIMKVRIDEKALYSFDRPEGLLSYIDARTPTTSSLVWTSAMRRLYILLARALRFNEPVLLVGETGCGKTSVCQVFAEGQNRTLHTINCHQNSETADFIGGLRPVRNKGGTTAQVLGEVQVVLANRGVAVKEGDADAMLNAVTQLMASSLAEDDASDLHSAQARLRRLNTIFEWHDGPLVHAMRGGEVFLMDEISLADDSVLERLNSVLEPSRTLVLAERGGGDLSDQVVVAHSQFKLIATMNPGGDYGKKELSPALRNRFTEIWVPPVTDRADLEQIVNSLWKHEQLQTYTGRLLDFVQWLAAEVKDTSICGPRDLLAWTRFSNAVFATDTDSMTHNEIFHHAAQLTFLDGLGSFPQLAAYSHDALQTLRTQASSKLHDAAPMDGTDSSVLSFDPNIFVQLGSFAIPRGPLMPELMSFNLQVPTTRHNAMRVFRACQLQKPILLEGSPGVGKTTLISALANISGHHLCRINLSDQTDLMDLFGSDLPVEGGKPGEFAWKDAEFLRALQEGHWVLLDEMNLAPQAVLEGLNAVLDHRGTVFIPELGRTFTRHPSFRIFAAQNPLHQGGGRKGLPKSFVNRFTKVYVEELTPSDLLLVVRHLFPDYPAEVLERMIAFNTQLNDAVAMRRIFGKEGAPWEFNLRDVFRWASLLRLNGHILHPVERLWPAYLCRFRNEDDRIRATALFATIFSCPTSDVALAPHVTITDSHVQIGSVWMSRHAASMPSPGPLLQTHAKAMEAAALAISQSSLVILTGAERTGKKTVVQNLARVTGHTLHRISIHSSTDTTDILGSFEQVDLRDRILPDLLEVLSLAKQILGLQSEVSPSALFTVERYVSSISPHPPMTHVLDQTMAVLSSLPPAPRRDELITSIRDQRKSVDQAARFEWVDGTLIRALREGHWLLMENANLCNASVLDRLNSLCEPGGSVVLNERGHVHGQVQVVKPHPSFRLFMTVNPQNGELSRAMRNRGIEIALHYVHNPVDSTRLALNHVLPASWGSRSFGPKMMTMTHQFETVRRGLSFDTTLSIPQATLSLPQDDDDESSRILATYSSSFALPTDDQLQLIALRQFSTSALPQRSLQTLRRSLPHQSQLLDTLAQSGLVEYLGRLRAAYSRTWGVPSNLLCSQPLNIYLNHPPPRLCASGQRDLETHDALLGTLDLWVATSGHDSKSSRIVQGIHGRNDIAAEPRRLITDTVNAVIGMARQALKSVMGGDPISTVSIERTSRLVDQVTFLQNVGTESPFDFSAALVVIQWILCALDAKQPYASHAIHTAEAFHHSISLTSGLGLQNLWSLLAPTVSLLSHSELYSSYESVPLDPAIRSQLLQVAAVIGLPGQTELDSLQLANIVRQLDQSLPNLLGSAEPFMMDPMMVKAEFDLLANTDDMNLEDIVQLLSLVQNSREGELLRFALYQRLTWLRMSSSDEGPLVMFIQKGWLEALWKTQDGPAVLVQASRFRTTLAQCNMSHSTLASIAEYKSSLKRQSSILAYASLFDHRSAAMPLWSMASHAVNSMLSVFGLTQKAGVIHSTHASPDNVTIHAHRAAQRFLGNTIGQVQDAQPSISEAGSTWIALARFLLAMYVPDKPIDPASMADSAVRYWQGQHERLSTVMHHHHALVYRTSGNPTNTVVEWLQDRLALTSTELAQARPSLVVAKRDVISVHAFWAETSHFLTEVLHQDKIDHLISSLERGEDASQSREEVVQESITGFCQRLEVGYPAFRDISATLQWALSQMKLGLRLIAYAGRITADTHFEERTKFTNALITVPTIVAVEALRGRSWQGLRHDSPPAAVLALHLQLALLGQKLGERDPDEVRALYDNVLGLWLKDKAATEKANHEAQSLFKSKTVDHDARSELEQEEAEFKALFPTYDDEVDQQSSATNTQKDLKRHLDAAHLRMIALVHLQLCDVRPSDSGNASLDQLRISLLEDTFESSSTLPETLDQDSLAFQLRLLHEQHKSTESTSTLSSDNFDFYHDTRIVEVEKAAGYVRSMSVRLGELIEEWPDQMVLQHLRDRCETILRLPLSSPIAQVLTSLEQLLLQSEDWEMYANRHNSLRTYRESLINTIVAWRRLELTCWSTLLQVQSLSFEDQAGEWWPTLYNACIRGALAAAQDEEAITLERYLDSLVPLVDHFLISSPLGQFARRLSLVQSFDRFTLAIAPTLSTAERDALYRVQLILRTTCDYYGQFSSNIAASLLAQRSALEKDVRAFIKLASWKDINVQALKASAVRTHHQLYKVIRKFREIMRQPIAQHIQTPPKELHVAALPLPLVAFESASASRYDACLPRTAHVGASAQTKNLPNTLSIFVDLALHRILPTQATHDAVIADNLATTIIERAEALAKEAMPVDIPPEKKTLAQKNLLTRKRKAWTDMLKELKRVGFSSAVKPDVLERQRSLRWLREQHTVTSNMTFGMETYFQKLQTVLPDLRLSVVDHHADISSRDMNRAMMFVESSFSVALQARNIASIAILEFEELASTIKRLDIVYSLPRIAAVGDAAHQSISTECVNFNKMGHALQELIDHLEIAVQSTIKVPEDLKDKVHEKLEQTRQVVQRLKDTQQSVELSSTRVMLEGDLQVVQEAIEVRSSVCVAISSWLECAPSLRYILRPLYTWLSARPSTLVITEPTDDSGEKTSYSEHLLETLLIRMQKLVALTPVPDPSGYQGDELGGDEDADNVIRDRSRQVMQTTLALHLKLVVLHINALLTSLQSTPASEVKRRLAVVLPFLARFLPLAKNQVEQQAAWARSLLKLTYVLANTVRSVAKEGFCRPPDVEDSGEGEGKTVEGAEGTGLGAGQGAEDVSKEIEDESQVEGLKGEQDEQQEGEKGEGDAVEMSEDFAGEMEDVDKGEEGEGEEDGSEEEDDGPEPEEQLGKLDASDPEAVDEKMWGDEKGPDARDDDQHAGDDAADQPDQDPSELAAKDEGKKGGKKDGKEQEKEQQEPEEDENMDEPEPGEDEAQEEEGEPSGVGVQMDDHVQEADTLDLPDDLHLDQQGDGEESDSSTEGDDMDVDEEMQVEEKSLEDQQKALDEEDQPGTPRPEEHPEPSIEDQEPHTDANDTTHEATQDDADDNDGSRNEQDTVANADISAGPTDTADQQDATTLDHDVGESTSQGQAAGRRQAGGQDAGDQDTSEKQTTLDDSNSVPQQDESRRPVEESGSGPAEQGGQQGNAPVNSASQLKANPLRNLGDALKEIQRRFDDILDAREQSGDSTASTQPVENAQLEYILPDEDAEMEALGPAGENEASKLSDLKLVDDESSMAKDSMLMDIDEPVLQEDAQFRDPTALVHHEKSTTALEGIESAVTDAEARAQGIARQTPDILEEGEKAEEDATEPAPEEVVEAALKKWLDEGRPDSDGIALWRLYDSLTHDLSHALCEQLRLILAPTLATRLKGDYRTGKRLNMKKIIPYVASEYRKDRIWLRRTRPSARTYQVLLAIDDSRSMAVGRSVHLAFETLALVSRALSRLEVGQVALTRFGKDVDVLHDFDDGPLGEAAGARAFGAFRFEQGATDVLGMLRASLGMLGDARAKQSGQEELWQLMVVVSDGVCQDHEALRAELRRAEEARVLVVFVVLDALHAHTLASDTSPAAGASILSMTQVRYRDVGNGAREMVMERYMDSFPFEYYVVLRRAEALPDVLASTLRQFFERVSGE